MGAPPPPPPGVPPSAPPAEDALPRPINQFRERAIRKRADRGDIDERIFACIRARGEAYAVDVMGDVHAPYSLVSSRLVSLENAGRLVSRKVEARDLPKETVSHGSGQGRRYYRLAEGA